MGEKDQISKAPTSILDQILNETFQELEKGKVFDNETVVQLRSIKCNIDNTKTGIEGI